MRDEREIRYYLLGILAAERRQEVDKRILTDDDFHQEVEIAEEELLDDYVRGNLAVQECRLFEEHFLASPLRRRRLTFARAFHEKINAPAYAAPGVLLKRSTAFYRYALVASLTLAAVLGGVGYSAYKAVQEERNRAAVLRKELEETRRQQAQLVPNIILQANLFSGGARGGPQPRLSIPKNTVAVRFVLAVPIGIHEIARVDLLNDAGQRILSQEGNLIEKGRNQNLLSALIESQYLKPGDYFLRVTPIDAPALPEYSFQVSKP
jgi:hypothetical protein